MTDKKETKPDEQPANQPELLATSGPSPRSMPTRHNNSEGALGLEMARLFGISPKLMMAPKPTPEKPPEPADDGDEGQPDA